MGVAKVRTAAAVWLIWAAGFIFALVAYETVSAELLPLKHYTTVDGLPRDVIKRIVRDSRGFLWFCTPEGLSRFDGYSFTNYTIGDGRSRIGVNDLLETCGGDYWVATGDGVWRFDPAAAPSTQRDGRSARASVQGGSWPMFTPYYPGDRNARLVRALLEDSTGNLWCGTAAGLYRLERSDGAWRLVFVDIGMSRGTGGDSVMTLLEDRHSGLWIGTYNDGLYRRWPDGRTEHYTTRQGLPVNYVKSLLEDHQGRLWLGTIDGLSVLVTEPDRGRPVVARTYTTEDGLASGSINSLYQSSDGRLFCGAGEGLSQLDLTARQARILAYNVANGLSGGITTLAEDRAGNLWIGTGDGGVMRLALNGLTTYSEADGLFTAWVTSIFESRSGELCVTSRGRPVATNPLTATAINRFAGNRFTPVKPAFPDNIDHFGWGSNQLTLQDRAGQWWIPTAQGLCRFPAVARIEQLASTRPLAVYTSRDGLVTDEVFRLFEDSRGDIWIATIGERSGVTRWDRASGTFHSYSEADGLPPSIFAVAFCEDRSGNVWVANNSNSLWRYSDHRFTSTELADQSPAIRIVALHIDHAGRLWFASDNDGIGLIDDPTLERPSFVSYTTAEGLSSNEVSCITEDQWGRIYIMTGRGLDRLDPETGRIKHYTAADGLVPGEDGVAFRDRQGTLWFGTTRGLSKLIPAPDEPQSPVPILISGLRIGGERRALSSLGETEVPELVLSPSQNQIQIDFVGLGFGMGEALQYRYMLEGADRDWGPPTDQRTVNYANLRSGSYRFLVRAFTSDGLASENAATFAFRILPPVWQRWWFLTPAAAFIGLMVYGIHRYRVGRLIELERVRTRIATDLHDDIGSSLSRMAILSEVVKQRPSAENSGDLLGEIAESGRRLVDAMSDIVWSIDPRRDDLSNLAARVREFAAGVLDNAQIKWTLEVPAEVDRVKLGPDERRQVFLILKEAITNVARHSECASVRMSIAVLHNRLLAEVKDDGCGIRTGLSSNSRGGQGLESMKRRAAHLGGSLSIASSSGRGTCLKFEVPVK